jgi:hypothetical protein
MFDVCTTAHIDTIFKLLPHTLTRVWQQLEYCIDVCRVTRGAHIEYLQLSKKNFFSFPLAVKNSIKVGPLVSLL